MLEGVGANGRVLRNKGLGATGNAPILLGATQPTKPAGFDNLSPNQNSTQTNQGKVATSYGTYVPNPPVTTLNTEDGGDPGAPIPPITPINPNPDYLQEAGYLAQVSALDQALQNFNTQDTAERGRYDVDYKAGLRDLGYRDENIDDTVPGTWDWNDLLTASGRGYQNNVNDFAGRGMIQSQAYLDAQDTLGRSLDDQVGAMGTSRQNFRKERDEGMANYKTQDTAARNTAAADAIARLQASLGLV